MIVTDKLSTESFHAFIDEQLTDEQYVQVEAQLDEIPEKIEEIQQCHIINERLREVFDPIVEEPVPEDLYELAIYGLESEQSQDTEILGDEPVSYAELEEDIAAIDSLDIFSESDDEDLLDDSDATDLELLAQTEHLSGFEIDSLRDDPDNIIPDIFDAEEQQQPEEQSGAAADATDGLLESIDTLSLEIEKAQENRNTHQDQELEEIQVVEESAEELLDELQNEELELEAYEDEQTDEQFSEAPEQHEEQEAQFAKDRVLETLTPEEELTLEPLEEEQSNNAFIQELESSAEEEAKQHNIEYNRSSRPRNLRSDQSIPDGEQPTGPDREKGPKETSMHVQPEPAAPGEPSELSTEHTPAREENLPEDLVAEFFSENKGPDFEVNEVVKQFEEVSENFNDPHDDYLFDEGPLANIKHKANQFVNETAGRLNSFKTSLLRKKSEILGKFGFAEPETDFNNPPIAGFTNTSSPQAATPADTLDLDAFEDFSRQADNQNISSGDESFELPDFGKENNIPDVDHKDVVAKTSKKKDTDRVAPEESTVPEPLVTPADQQAGEDFGAPQDFGDIDFGSNGPAKEDESKQARAVPGFDMDIGVDGEPASGNLVNKFGDTLRAYKQKIAEMRAASMDQTNEENSTLEKYKNIVTSTIQNLQGIVAVKFAAVGILAVVLLVGIFAVMFGGESASSLNNQKLEKLAIDTHLLNSQFKSKIAKDADSAIIEKLQWYSARVGRQVRLADIRVEDFEFKKVEVLPTMASFAAVSIFENKAGQRITLLAIPDAEPVNEVQMSCRIPVDVDGLCVWVKDSVRYIAVASLSLSRVRAFSEQIIESL